MIFGFSAVSVTWHFLKRSFTFLFASIHPSLSFLSEECHHGFMYSCVFNVLESVILADVQIG